MKKLISGSRIIFYDDNNQKIMYIDYSTDECVWFFESSKSIEIEESMELYEPLSFIMKQKYVFNEKSVLKSYKIDNKLVWYSDCYYDPDDEWSKNWVSFLTIELKDGLITVTPKKTLEKNNESRDFFHCICFSPLGNGEFTRNETLGTSLQDDFVKNVYYELLQNKKVKKIGENKKNS